MAHIKVYFCFVFAAASRGGGGEWSLTGTCPGTKVVDDLARTSRDGAEGWPTLRSAAAS